ncbi:hypothetical protein [Micromonospora matsumotoense]
MLAGGAGSLDDRPAAPPTAVGTPDVAVRARLSAPVAGGVPR